MRVRSKEEILALLVPVLEAIEEALEYADEELRGMIEEEAANLSAILAEEGIEVG